MAEQMGWRRAGGRPERGAGGECEAITLATSPLRCYSGAAYVAPAAWTRAARELRLHRPAQRAGAAEGRKIAATVPRACCRCRFRAARRLAGCG